MAAFSNTNNLALFKRWYVNRRVEDLTYPESPFWAMIPKTNDFVGEAKAFAVRAGLPTAGRSRTFATAQTNKGASLERQFLLTRVKDYLLASIEQEAILSSSQTKGAFEQLQRTAIDTSLKGLTANLGTSMFRNSGGYRARVGSGGATTTLTLADPRDVVNFEVGMWLTTGTTDGTSGSPVATSKQIGAINRQAGTLESASGNWNSGGGFADTDYIFQVGDFGASISGLESWLPAVAPSPGDNFFGVDRSVDTDRYAGIRYDATGQTLEEGLISTEAELQGVAGGNPAVVLMNPVQLRKLKIELGSRVVYDRLQARGLNGTKSAFSFKAVMLTGSRMDIAVIADRYCPESVAYMLQMDTWEFASLGQAPRIANAMGVMFQWDYNADSVEIRTGYYGNMGCYAPGFNARVALPTG